MKKFKFRLDSVLRVRRHEEEQQRQRHARVVRQRQELEELREETVSRLRSFNERRNNRVGNPQSPFLMRQELSFMEDQHNRLLNIDNKIKRVEDKQEKERKRLIEANKKTKILENLESKQRVRFFEDMERLEQKELNEIAIQRYNWQRR